MPTLQIHFDDPESDGLMKNSLSGAYDWLIEVSDTM